MRQLPICIALAVTLGVAVALTACSAAAQTRTPTEPASFTDPFAYCAAIGTIDAPDARYTGPQVPDQIIEGFKNAAGLQASTEPFDVFRKATIWRCMNGKVYACNFGANLPCDSKANTERTPTQAMADFCTTSPNTDFIPMSVTGHDTVYSWRCVGEKPELDQQIASVDAQGFLAQIWYPIGPSP